MGTCGIFSFASAIVRRLWLVCMSASLCALLAGSGGMTYACPWSTQPAQDKEAPGDSLKKPSPMAILCRPPPARSSKASRPYHWHKEESRSAYSIVKLKKRQPALYRNNDKEDAFLEILTFLWLPIYWSSGTSIFLRAKHIPATLKMPEINEDHCSDWEEKVEWKIMR